LAAANTAHAARAWIDRRIPFAPRAEALSELQQDVFSEVAASVPWVTVAAAVAGFALLA